MPRVIAQQELNILVELISAEPVGIGIEAIAQKLDGSYQRRTLQRRLALLVEQQRIEMFGEKRATRYRRLTEPGGDTATQALAQTPWQVSAQDYVPISAQGADIRAYVSQPRHLRSPVGYRLEFLAQYHPNHTAYLSQDLRDLEGLTAELIGKLSQAGVQTRDDLADLAVDELTDITGQSEEDARALILKAREHWFADQE